MKKIITMAIILSLLMPLAMADTTRIYPTDDAYIRGKSSERNNNFGSSQDLKSGFQASWGDQESYLIFDLSSLSGKEISSASFSIDIISNTDSPVINLKEVSSTSWSENSITWNNKPSTSSTLQSKNINSNNRVDFDITSYISQNTGNKISLALIEDGDDGFIQSFSKEYSSTGTDEDKQRWPYLEITFSGSGQQCNTSADSNCDGCVDLLEMVGTMLDYKQGNSSLSLLEMVNIMLQYKGGEISC
jgi:hypothetical protein